jgi:cytoskeletal protein RodZ
MSLGNTLRAAREACGITTSELAARTHMLVQIVEGLENDDFRRIPAPIYGRGFIKLYCEAVGIDPKPLQAEFMDQFNKAKNAPEKVEIPAARSRTQAKTVEPQTPVEQPVVTNQPSIETTSADETSVNTPVTEEQSVAETPEQADSVESLFELPIQTPKAEPINLQPPPKRSYGDIFEQSYAAEDTSPKQSAAEKFRNTMSNVSSGVFANVQKLPPNTGRIITVSVLAILVLSLIGWGVYALYTATTPESNDKVLASENVKTEKADVKESEIQKPAKDLKSKPTSKTKTSVKPGELKSSRIEVPSLYID